MWPHRDLAIPGESELSLALRLGGQEEQRVSDFIDLDPALKTDGTKMVRVQALRQPSQDGLIGIGGHAVDDELSASDVECARRAVREQLVGSSEDVSHPGTDRRVVARIHRIPVKGH